VFVGKSWNSFSAEPRLIAALRAAIPPSGSPPDGGQSPQKLTNLLVGGCKKFFSNKESIFAGFASLLTQGRAAGWYAALCAASRKINGRQ